MGEIRDSFVMSRDWVNAANALPEEYQLEVYKGIAQFGLTGEIPEGLSQVAHAILLSLETRMKNNIARYNASIENGKKGGRPPKNEEKINENKNLEKPSETQSNLEKPSLTQEKPKITQQNLDKPSNNLEKPSDNPYVNVYDNDIDNVDDNLVSYKNIKNYIFSDYARTHACKRVSEKTEKERQPFIDFFDKYFKYCFNEELKSSAYEVIDTILEAFYQANTKECLKYSQKVIDNESFCKTLVNLDSDKFEEIVSQVTFNATIRNRPSYILSCILEAGNTPTSQNNSMKTKELLTKLGELV